MLAAFLATTLFSFAAISGRRLAHFVTGTQANLARLILASAFLGILAQFLGKAIRGDSFLFLFLSGCVGFGIGDLAMFQAYPRLGSRRTMVMIQCLAAPFAGLLEWLWLHHAPTLTQAIYGAIILAGVGIALMPHKSEAQPTRSLTAGILFGALSAFCQGGGAVISRKAFAVAQSAGHPFHSPADGISAAFQRTLGGIVISALFLAYLRTAHKSDAVRKNDWRTGWRWVVANAISGPALGVSCYQWALMTEKTSIVLPIVATTPLAVMPLAHYMEGDRITWRTVLGGVIAVAGVIGLTLAAQSAR